MSKLVSNESTKSSLDEIARQGARQMLIKALELEANDYINANKNQRNEQDHRLVVRNGKAKERSVTLGCGTVKVNAPRINDQRAGNSYFNPNSEFL